MKVGDQIWRFDENHRVYRKRDGRPYESPVYREHWIKVWIVGETRVSWLVGYRADGDEHFRVPKKGPHRGFAFNVREIDDDIWLKDHRYSIVRAIERTYNAEVLRRVADIVGWKESDDA